MGIWSCGHHNMKFQEYEEEYLKHMKRSERVDEFDDRSRLYSVETLIINSAHFPGKDTRQLTVKELEYLIKKYLDVD